ncbi:golgin subfamily A member 5-like [Euwallacea fornicatus]|uniref:golgin subfamily A member 5-like n=1 Tax=Euwallacea fornicatus TaxID=995702 RepID=UPI00338FE358
MNPESEFSNSEYQSIKTQLEEITRKLKLREQSISQLQAEDEILDQQNSDRAQQQVQLADLTQALSNEESNHQLEIDNLKSQILAKAQCLSAFEKELEQLESEKVAEYLNQREHEENKYSEYLLLSESYNILLKEVESWQQACDGDQKKLLHLQQKEVDMQELFKSKKSEFHEKIAQIDALQEELLEINMALEMCPKSFPKGECVKGSLFSEVNDERMHLQETLNAMKHDYLELEIENSKEKKLISHMQSQIASLRDLETTIMQQIQEVRLDSEQCYMSRLELLKGIVAYKRRKLDFQIDDVPAEQTRTLFEKTINELKDDVKFLESKFSDWRLSEHMFSSSLAQTQVNIRKQQLTIKQLKTTLEEMECAKSDTDDYLFDKAQNCESPPRGYLKPINVSEETFAEPKTIDIKRDSTEENSLAQKFSSITLRKGNKENHDSEKTVMVENKSVKFSKDTVDHEQPTFQPRGRKVYVFPKKTS